MSSYISGLLGGAGAGALTGGAIGGPLGAGIGAGAGGLLGLFGGYSSSKREKENKKAQKDYMKKYGKEKVTQVPMLPKNVQKLYDKYIKLSGKELKNLTPLNKIPLPSQSPMAKKVGGVLSDLISPDSKAYQKFKAPYMREFQRDILPGVATRHSLEGLAGSGAKDIEQTAAGQDLSTNLATLKTNLMTSALGPALNYASMPYQEQLGLRGQTAGLAQNLMGMNTMHTQFQPGITPQYQSPQPGFMGNLAQSAAGGLGEYGAKYGLEKLFASLGKSGSAPQSKTFNLA